MSVPTPGAGRPRMFSREHQSRAARARHHATELQHVAFNHQMDELWSRSESPLSRFSGAMRAKIQRGDFAGDYCVSVVTLTAWFRQWRKALTSRETSMAASKQKIAAGCEHLFFKELTDERIINATR